MNAGGYPETLNGNSPQMSITKILVRLAVRILHVNVKAAREGHPTRAHETFKML